MKFFAFVALFALAVLPAGISAQATDLTGVWNTTFTRTGPGGQTQTINATFHLTQEGRVLTGTVRPDEARQWKIEKGVVEGTKVTFQVQQPDGPLRSFTLELTNGRLQGTQKLEFNGQTAEVTVDAARAK